MRPGDDRARELRSPRDFGPCPIIIPVVALSQQQKDCLSGAIEAFGFPTDYFDFVNNAPEHFASTKDVEVRVRQALISGEPACVKDGLSNVLYWGYAQMGIRGTRIRRFREKVTLTQLNRASDLFRGLHVPSVVEIKNLGLPEFSGLSFVSKVRMFLDPGQSATLDWQILKIHQHCPTTLLAQLHIGKSTQIPITKRNSGVYEDWCRKMLDISLTYFNGRFRAVDIERGFFELIQRGRVSIAAHILNNA
jgi:hypothetical protein